MIINHLMYGKRLISFASAFAAPRERRSHYKGPTRRIGAKGEVRAETSAPQQLRFQRPLEAHPEAWSAPIARVSRCPGRIVLAGIAQNLRSWHRLSVGHHRVALELPNQRAGRSKPVVNSRMADGHPSAVTDFRNKVCYFQTCAWGLPAMVPRSAEAAR